MSKKFESIRTLIRDNTLCDEGDALRRLIDQACLSEGTREKITSNAVDLISRLRGEASAGLMEVFLAEYGLSTEEGVALMCLAEALLRVPDAETIDALIEDKIAPSDWGKHLGHSSSSLVNASTWALMLTGKVLSDDDDSLLGGLRSAVKRLGEPVIRTAVAGAMREMGKQFVLGRDIEEAIQEAREHEAAGFTYSYDMLGEAACTDHDAARYHIAYSQAIGALADVCTSDDIRNNPGISVKLSALHPRYEYQQRDRVMDELVPRTRSLALLAKSAGMGFNIDAEEADRLDLSLDVIRAVLSDPSLKQWDGFGIVVQAYGQRASYILDILYELAVDLDRKIMVRLVKGAYWDTEIKLAQTMGIDGFPVFTHKAATDVSYIANAQKLLGMTDRIYPQFATHNAHTVCSILEMAKDKTSFEFQRLHGMGENLHKEILEEHGTRCRIYAPVGAHRDLLAYLVRRLLENGANSSFVNQIVDASIPAGEMAADPFEMVLAHMNSRHNPAIRIPTNLYGETRRNSKGWNLADPVDVESIKKARERFKSAQWKAFPLVAGKQKTSVHPVPVLNPAYPQDLVGSVVEADERLTDQAVAKAKPWDEVTASERANVLRCASDLFEENFGELFALLSREAGKTALDCIGELREAVDFLRYYASEAERLDGTGARGIITCISPWNFPLAIFTGQLSAALAAGNGVIAKPAESTSLIAYRAVQFLHEAGVPGDVLQLLPGKGNVVGASLTANPGVAGICFTGSTGTAQRINRTMADCLDPNAPLIAETGGLNAMIVDSTALPEQAVRDIVTSAFQSAGQRCSALRILYLQDDIAEHFLEMLKGAMDELSIGDPWLLSTDVGPVIDEAARSKIEGHLSKAEVEGRVIKRLESPSEGNFVPPSLLKVDGILDLEEEIFGPVLHVATYQAEEIDEVIDQINASGYGLTFGLHTRIDDRVQHIVDRVKVGNIYVNRNQIGAIVGSQPFGGEGLSGTGPKAGGPNYVKRFTSGTKQNAKSEITPTEPFLTSESVQSIISKARTAYSESIIETLNLPGPTGESNRLSLHSRGVFLCLGPGSDLANNQADRVRNNQCLPIRISDGEGMELNGSVDLAALTELRDFDGVCWSGDRKTGKFIRQALAKRPGRLIPLVTDLTDDSQFHLERHVCVDTTASGGNAELLAAQ